MDTMSVVLLEEIDHCLSQLLMYAEEYADQPKAIILFMMGMHYEKLMINIENSWEYTSLVRDETVIGMGEYLRTLSE